MKILLSIILVFQLGVHLFSQNYRIESFQSEYIPLSEYTSICSEGLDGRDFTVDFDFDFPYQDTFFRSINANNLGLYSFYDVEGWYTIALMNFIYDQDCDESDVDTRYVVTEVNDQSVAIVENSRLVLANDESPQSYISFQNWFYEDGTMEIHIGDVNLDESTAYVEGEGFYLSGGPSLPLGPYVRLRDYQADTTYFRAGGYYVGLTPNLNQSAALTHVPPKGWVISLIPRTLNTSTVEIDKFLHIYPNPASDRLTIDMPLESGMLSIHSLSGKSIYQQQSSLHQHVSIDVGYLQPGLYLVQFISEEGEIYLERFVKE